MSSMILGARARPFLNPLSIAVIGASADEDKIGGRPIKYLRLAGYSGPIYPINPKRDAIHGLKCYPSITAVDDDIDLAIISVPAQEVLSAVESCVAKRVSGVLIFSSGFSEVDEAGRILQERIVQLASEGGVALLGPNCAGTFNTRAGLLATFSSGILDKPPQPGSISFVSQSGAFGINMLVLAGERDLGLSMCLTSGNQADVDVAEALAYMAQDPETEVIGVCIEGIPDFDRFLAAIELARRNRKPVIVLKLGRSEVGARAVASHTASIAGSDEVFDAILRQYSVCRAHSIEELLDIAYACSLRRHPPNDKLGIITVSGGVGILTADQASAAGLDVAELPAQPQAAIKALLPFAAAGNPVDVTAQITTQPALVEPMFEHMLAGGYGSSIALFTYLPRNRVLFEKMLFYFERVASRYPGHFFVICALTDSEMRTRLESMGYAVFDDPGRAVRAIRALVDFQKAFDLPSAVREAVVMLGAKSVRRGAVYDEFQAKKLLALAGIPGLPEELVSSVDQALGAAKRIGYPLVMKIVSPEIKHKSEIGGVLLDIKDTEQVRQGYETLLRRAADAAPNAEVRGVLMARQVKGGVETILGVFRDPVIGPIVMFGLGGVLVEILKDVTFRRAPISRDEAYRMIREVKGHALLQGVRGVPAADEDALIVALVKLSIFAASQIDSIESIDVNPFVVLPAGNGAFALDALIEVRSA
ncbi:MULTISPECIES: acetate--CoA ligase family protein [Alcaligenaceae]|uniref:Acetyl-CoA synthetase n=1 Tax=Bordetella petrii (strain ATCC BAA-461 / DSM 12804 / CCUG 43448 / CIP 107267 / Se-1111R) TaxID=340100 RepID=A9ICA6_BORPD|nr:MULTISPECIES: acetate--CoA ligase family protein [Alcaligenaceae]CAP41544.1 Acetyl-CoA synthetase [Bordetella petrii]CUJ31023.1 succinyl-CoA synthetase subunit alpha [Achromobacter xylosoxidans]CUJ71107.1 succinyl-CoA synthetase subunit alpha [Achromobacter xylosoxidans]